MKIFDIVVGRTVLREEEARGAGMNATTTELPCWDHKAYYPGAEQIHLRITGDPDSGKLHGAQILRHWKSEIAKRLDALGSKVLTDC